MFTLLLKELIFEFYFQSISWPGISALFLLNSVKFYIALSLILNLRIALNVSKAVYITTVFILFYFIFFIFFFFFRYRFVNILPLLIISIWAYLSFISFFWFLNINAVVYWKFSNNFDSNAPTFINIIGTVVPILFDSDWLWSYQRDGATNTLISHMVSEMVSIPSNHQYVSKLAENAHVIQHRWPSAFLHHVCKIAWNHVVVMNWMVQHAGAEPCPPPPHLPQRCL